MTSPKRALFAPGNITCSQAALAAMSSKVGTTGLALLCRHITGNWGDSAQAATNQAAINGEPLHDTVVSRYRFPGDIEIVITTWYIDTPSLRWTDICLAEEAIETEPDTGDDEMLEPVEEAALILEELTATEESL